ncbi:hypothetical protein PFISCL1PPCAC_29005 [Pristionchus fissidentatus]|uniref:Peptide-N(4)-(N-acetyl-beta-glucosaminyl)asparagine amidase n=1 Tax=Pristionchus fissidentatus TaxID=1538716 RepID=A0AAV5X451_9BILA|nr:hypothetical protein PFISCL1PPCAC_12314 [Pristionchus fissidentatus]GMT37708.1 hypothetical protein PFISCL1PPCAC_29005 [Pristionchus fissidentatus]
MVLQLQSSADLDALITRLGQNGCIFIDFFAHWCGPCRNIAPFYASLVARFPTLTFTKVNVDEARDIAMRYGIRAMPTFVVLRGGQEAERIQGANPNRLLDLAQQYAATAAPPNPLAATAAERQFLQAFALKSTVFSQHYDNELGQMLARSVVPPRISDAIEEKGPTLETAVELLKWFKSDFFRWVDAPDCPQCKKNTKGENQQPAGAPTPEEQAHGAGRVELHTCAHCGAIARFPRYNDPVKLIETRGGRCGEWANCFVLIAHSMGFPTRYILDMTDHVWAELFVANRWVHFDPCEAAFDKPLLYEVGWKKQLSYVIAFGRDHVADVTWKYVRDPKETRKLRRMVREPVLSSFLSKLSTRLLNSVIPSEAERKKRDEEIRREKMRELIECIRVGPIDEKDYGGRISGDVKWRLERGETDGKAAEKEEEELIPYTIKVTKEQANEESEFVVEYDVVKDEYNIGGDVRPRFLGAMAQWSNVQRKVEQDWRKAYICREEGEPEGLLEWKIDLNGVEVEKVTVEAREMLQQEGSRVILTVCSGDQCMMVFPGRKLEISGEDLSPGATLSVKAQFVGGSASLSFQHAQLFRASLDDPQNPHLSMRFKLK